MAAEQSTTYQESKDSLTELLRKACSGHRIAGIPNGLVRLLLCTREYYESRGKVDEQPEDGYDRPIFVIVSSHPPGDPLNILPLEGVMSRSAIETYRLTREDLSIITRRLVKVPSLLGFEISARPQRLRDTEWWVTNTYYVDPENSGNVAKSLLEVFELPNSRSLRSYGV